MSAKLVNETLIDCLCFDRLERKSCWSATYSVYGKQLQSYGANKVWQQLLREGIRVARCTAAHAVAFCTEGSFLRELGIDTVILGPGNIAQDHQPDQYLSLSNIQPCVDICLN